jgi:hypothetical protein
MFGEWTCPLPDGQSSTELVVAMESDGPHKILILPALFDEANKLRRFTLQTMRALGEAGIASTLPDLPAMNESLASLPAQSLESWRAAAAHAAKELSPTHVLAIRGSALIAPETLPTWHYSPVKGARILRNMLRARVITSREAGLEESTDALLAQGMEHGLELAGWPLSADMIAQLQEAEPVASHRSEIIEQKQLGGAGLWLRAEPDEAPEQSAQLARHIAAKLQAS